MFRKLRRMGSGLCSVAVLVLVVGVSGAAASDFAAFTKECGLRFGWGRSAHADENITLYSFLPRWGLFLTDENNPYLGKLRLSVLLEGQISVADCTHGGWEFGLTPLLKVSYPVLDRVLAFAEGGAGVIWENIDTVAIAHTFNFSPQVGAGFDIHLAKGFALTLAYRWRHVSNAGLYDDNQNFNCHFGHLGLTYFY